MEHNFEELYKMSYEEREIYFKNCYQSGIVVNNSVGSTDVISEMKLQYQEYVNNMLMSRLNVIEMNLIRHNIFL